MSIQNSDNESPIRVAVTGAAGRMGRAILEVVQATENMEIVLALEHTNSDWIGSDVGLLLGTKPQSVAIVALEQQPDKLQQADVIIDFTIPEATASLIPHCVLQQCAMVIGTTGMDAQQKQQLQQAAAKIPIVAAPNMSLGIHLMLQLVRQAATQIGHEADIEIIEAHHRNKIDAPSGTALRLGEEIAQVLDRPLSDCAVYGREGRTGKRDQTTIGFETIRAGDIVGDHTVLFATEGECLEITHKATNRKNFAKGAVRAAQWLQGKVPGLYGMADVLG